MTPWVLRLIIANIAVYFLERTGTGIANLLAFVPSDALVRPWTLVTYMFVHASTSHILFNMLSLYFFGPRVEERLGSRRFITLYGLSGISGAILSMIFAPYAPIVGASKRHHLDDAVAALSLRLTAEEIAALEEPYVPHPVAGFS